MKVNVLEFLSEVDESRRNEENFVESELWDNFRGSYECLEMLNNDVPESNFYDSVHIFIENHKPYILKYYEEN